MPTIGFDKLYYADITEDANGSETYGTPMLLGGAITADLSVEFHDEHLPMDDDPGANPYYRFKSGKLVLNVDQIGAVIASKLTGAQIDNNGVVVSSVGNKRRPVAVGFRSLKSNDTYRYIWLYRVFFGVPASKHQTVGDSITWQTPSIEGIIYRRNKIDGQGKHPWRAEVDESTATAVATAAWFNAVYEPNFIVWFTLQPDSIIKVTEGAISATIETDTAIKSGESAATYQWYSNTVNANTGGSAVSGQTTKVLTVPTGLTNGVHYFYCVATSGTATVASNVTVVIVNGG
jgi:phi13 family phage major tail protein